MAGGPDEIALTDEGLARAFSVGARVRRGPAADALEALSTAGGVGALSERGDGARIRRTTLGRFDQLAWGHLRHLGYVESYQDASGDGVRLTDAGRAAVQRGLDERASLLERCRQASRSPCGPQGPDGTPTTRILFIQSLAWDQRRGVKPGGGVIASAYSKDHCCFCYRPVKPGAPQLRLTRDESGEWFVVVPPGRAELPDEKTFGHFTLPIGPDCLRRHPEFRPGLVEDDPSGYLRLAAREGLVVR